MKIFGNRWIEFSNVEFDKFTHVFTPEIFEPTNYCCCVAVLINFSFARYICNNAIQIVIFIYVSEKAMSNMIAKENKTTYKIMDICSTKFPLLYRSFISVIYVIHIYVYIYILYIRYIFTIYIYIYIYNIHTHTHIYIYIYIYTIATSKNPSVVNTICISSFHYIHVLPVRDFANSKSGE